LCALSLQRLLQLAPVSKPSLAQDAADATYPNKPVRIFVPFSPGSATDAIIRICAQLLSEQFGQGFIVENLSGAGFATAT